MENTPAAAVTKQIEKYDCSIPCMIFTQGTVPAVAMKKKMKENNKQSIDQSLN